MKRTILAFATLFSAVSMLTSCLGDDDSNIDYYNDTAITAFSLGTLNQYLHTTSSTGKCAVIMSCMVELTIPNA